jgi:glucan phosphoethanolaminetransferase (alkaline phosphatase superfamily)
MLNRKSIILAVIATVLLLLPCLVVAFASIDLNYSVVKQCGYLLMVLVCLLLPALFLRARTYFIVEGIFNFLLFPIELASIYLNKQSATPLFIQTILSTNWAEATELLISFWWAVLVVVLLWVVYFCLVARIENVYIFSRSWRKRLAVVCIFIGLSVYGAVGVVVWRCATVRTVSYILSDTHSKFWMKFEKIFPYNIYIGVCKWFQVQREWKQSQAALASFRFGVEPQEYPSANPLFVLYIGESARYDHFQVNGYNRPTTPYLDTCSNLISFHHIYSQANLTSLSVPLILTRATADNRALQYSERSVVEAFAEAGFQTAFIEKNSYTLFVWRIMNTCSYHYLYSTGIDNSVYDTDMLCHLQKTLSDSAQMAVLHSIGSHFKYCLRYPDEDAYFQPSMTAKDGYSTDEANKTAIINAYDNTIRQTDKALGELIDYLRTLHRPAVVLYLSDHGESLWDDARKLVLHGSYECAEAEYHIPFLVWYSDSYANLYPDKVKQMRANSNAHVSSQVVFHSLLDLADIQQIVDSTHSVCSPYLQSTDTIMVLTGCGAVVPLVIEK